MVWGGSGMISKTRAGQYRPVSIQLPGLTRGLRGVRNFLRCAGNRRRFRGGRDAASSNAATALRTAVTASAVEIPGRSRRRPARTDLAWVTARTSSSGAFACSAWKQLSLSVRASLQRRCVRHQAMTACVRALSRSIPRRIENSSPSSDTTAPLASIWRDWSISHSVHSRAVSGLVALTLHWMPTGPLSFPSLIRTCFPILMLARLYRVWPRKRGYVPDLQGDTAVLGV